MRLLLAAVLWAALVSVTKAEPVVFTWADGLPNDVTEENWWNWQVKTPQGVTYLATVSKFKSWANDRRATDYPQGYKIKVLIYQDDDQYPPAANTPAMLRTRFITVPQGGLILEMDQQTWLYSPEQ